MMFIAPFNSPPGSMETERAVTSPFTAPYAVMSTGPRENTVAVIFAWIST